MKIDISSFKKKWVKPPKIQFPTGSRVYKGFQGSGKTLSMVKYAFDLQKEFPDCLIYSNVLIKGLKNCYFFDSDDGLIEGLTRGNGERGVLVLLDEAHLYFGKKSGIPLDVLTAISQQRKDRRRIVFSSQIWEELDISLRKQVKEIVSCKTIFSHFFPIQINIISDGESLSYDKFNSEYVAKKLYTEIFHHNLELYSSYDTRQKIITNQNYNRLPSSNPLPSVSVFLNDAKTKKR